MPTPTCPHCRASLPAPRSRLVGALVVGVAWILAMTMVFIGILTGPIIIVLLPMLVPSGISMITAAQTWAFEDWTCDGCGKLVELGLRVRTGSPTANENPASA